MAGMRLPSVFKTRQPKQFEFTPRYYNEAKEAMRDRKARIKAELERGNNKIVDYDTSHLRGSLKQKWKSNKDTSNFSKKSNSRILVILVLLFGLAYLVLK
tara:strand:+ start:3185 stop:3484 length:300 start_codon:yes stop_codon:yes gene_type:complete